MFFYQRRRSLRGVDLESRGDDAINNGQRCWNVREQKVKVHFLKTYKNL